MMKDINHHGCVLLALTKKQSTENWPASAEKFYFVLHKYICKVFYPEKGLVMSTQISYNRMFVIFAFVIIHVFVS
jgi:hypothetical protein